MSKLLEIAEKHASIIERCDADLRNLNKIGTQDISREKRVLVIGDYIFNLSERITREWVDDIIKERKEYIQVALQDAQHDINTYWAEYVAEMKNYGGDDDDE